MAFWEDEKSGIGNNKRRRICWGYYRIRAEKWDRDNPQNNFIIIIII